MLIQFIFKIHYFKAWLTLFWGLAILKFVGQANKMESQAKVDAIVLSPQSVD